MVGYFKENGRNVIWDFPERPDDPDFRNVSFDDPHDGIYIFGQNVFSTRPITITGIFHRNLTGNAEEFLLGVLSVLLIALLSEIVQAILMHTRRARRPGRKGVRLAFLVDEFYHFRNVWSHLFGRFTRNSTSTADPDKRRRVITSVTILLIALGLMAADVFAVYLTQPTSVASSDYQYNIRGFTPTFTNQGLGRFVRRLSRERPCVTPTFIQDGQERLYTVSACTTIDTEQNHDENEGYEGAITVGSWFHKAGSDHNITFGASRFSIKSRTVMYVSEGAAHRILYDVIEKDDFRFTKFLHELFITNVMEVSCNRRTKDGKRFANTWCDEILDLRRLLDQGAETRRVVFWSRRDSKNEEDDVRGWVSSYNVTLERVWNSVDIGLSPLTTTALLEEVQGPGQYVNITNEVFNDNLDGLLHEEGRVAGLLALAIAFLSFSLLLFILRMTLRPTSLGAMAWGARENMSDSSSDSGRKEDLAPQTNSVGGSSSASLNYSSNVMSQSTLEHQESANNAEQTNFTVRDAPGSPLAPSPSSKETLQVQEQV